MSNHESQLSRALSSLGRARRLFLRDTAFVAAGVSATVLSSKAATSPDSDTPPDRCPNITIPMKEVEGKVAFITGGSSGIGLGIARAFANAGMKIVLGYRTQSHIDEAMKYLEGAANRIHAINVDVTDRPGMERAAEETVRIFGKVHVLVNNAGITLHVPASETTYDDWDWTMSVNVAGVFNGVHTFLPRIRAHSEGGQVITTSSVVGLVGASVVGAYAASKFAVVGFMESLRQELLDKNVGVSILLPGRVNSNILDPDRNRPKHLSDTKARPASALEAADRSHMDPLEVGQIALRGMRNNDLYIFTHPEFEPILRARNEALMASIPTDLKLSETRSALRQKLSQSQDSMYSIERDRKRCAQMASAKPPK